MIFLVAAVEFFLDSVVSIVEVYIVSSTNGTLMFSSKRFDIQNRYNEHHSAWREICQRIYNIFFRSTVATCHLLALKSAVFIY